MTLAEPAPTVALKHLALSIQTGPFGSQLHAEDYSVGGRPVVNPAHLRDGRIEPDPNVAVDEETFAQLAQHELKAGDVVIGRRGELGRCAVVEADQEGWLCGTGSIRLRPNVGKLEPRWLRWLLSWSGTRDWLSLASVGTTMENVGAEIVGGMPLPMVSISAQRTVADYLDRETARLDALVAAKERVLGLLAEKRRALITRAVTRGLDPRAPLRDSGIPWLGEIPSHWETSKFSWRVFIVEGQVDPEVEPYSHMSLIAPNHVEIGTGRLLGQESAGDQGAISGKYHCLPGDVIYSKIRPALRKATIASEECLCSADMYPLRAREGLRPEFLLLYLLAEPFSTWAILESNRVAMPKINREALNEIRIPVPPPDEQRLIAAHIQDATARIDRVRSATEGTLALLKERRAALIAAAVTGQIGIPEVAA